MSSIMVSFPDGKQVEFPQGITGMEIAKSISEGLARNSLAIKVNGEVQELAREVTTDATIEILTWDANEGKETFWHSSAHILAEAVQELYPEAKFTIGPPIDSGFYYDIDFGGNPPSSNDLEKIEKKFKELASKKNVFERKEVSKADALKFYQELGNEYKVELINDLEDGSITFYTQGGFTDLCRGPHLPHTGFVKAVKLTAIAGAYWRGNEKNPQLTRIYGVTFPKASMLTEHLEMLEEARKRDHRKIGKELELFTFDDDVGPGLPLWLPKGAAMVEAIEDLGKRMEFIAGYERVRSPHLAKESMYLTSGHLPYYADSMFPPMEIDGTKYYLKAMNCPHHHKAFGATPKSYKDLPIRLAEFGTCYRYEKSGELFGLMRVRSLQMNDAHIYCTKEQFEEEFRKVNELYQAYFKLFGIDKYVMRLSTHSKERLGIKYVNEPELWLETEDMVRQVLIDMEVPYVEVADEAAFYGPKIDVQIYSAIGKEFTLATNQVDFHQGKQFNLTFTNQNNEAEHPIIIHRAPLSTHERLIGFLIEHYAGDFPIWLAPTQVRLLTISEKFNDYAKQVERRLRMEGIRVEMDLRSEKIGKKIRESELGKIPVMVIIGEKEATAEAVNVRNRGQEDWGDLPLTEFIQKVVSESKPNVLN